MWRAMSRPSRSGLSVTLTLALTLVFTLALFFIPSPANLNNHIHPQLPALSLHPQFIESLARVAAWKWHDEVGSSLFEKFARLVGQVRSSFFAGRDPDKS